MATIERVQRPFWMHQIVEYVLGVALIMTAVQQPEPAIPAMMGLLVLLNAAIAIGPAGAFRLVPRRLHKQLDLVVIGSAVLHGGATVLEHRLDRPADHGGDRCRDVLHLVPQRLHVARGSQGQAGSKAAARGGQRPVDSETVGKSAGRIVGEGVNSLKRWKDSMGSD